MSKAATSNVETIAISAPNFGRVSFLIRGNAPYVQNRFSTKARKMMQDKQEAGSVAKKGAKRDAKDFDAQFEGSMHSTVEGWRGIPASAFRRGMIDACRLVGFKMTQAKLGVFIEADGFDVDDGTSLVKITKGSPRRNDSYVRLATGVADITARAMWEPGWEAELHVKYDADMFTKADVANLVMRVGAQVGVGAGRPNSKESAGCEWGTFKIVSPD